jgi:two-component system, NtrC family, response regulator AtoC
MAGPARTVRVLLVDASPEGRAVVPLLAQQGAEVLVTGDPAAAARELAARPYDLVIGDGALLDAPELAAAQADGLRQGRTAIRPPVVRRAADFLEGMVGLSRGMQEVFRTIEKVAQHKASVLITGESGTGKELVARAIHRLGPRAHERFVAINCGAIPATLLESELFGYRRGAFTDAVRDKAGLFEEATGGTLFLDEIGELPVELQVKILRALQEEEIRRIGDNASIKIDVRVIAATLRDLSDDIRTGHFREDLFYRLNVLPIALPPLRDRREDIPALVGHFVERHSARHPGSTVVGVSPDAMKLLCSYAWPGNIRELENAIERAMVLCEGTEVEPAMLGEALRQTPDPIQQQLGGTDLSIKKTTRIVEEELIRRALASTNGNRTNAAKLLEISHRALLYKIKEYGL